MHKDERTAACLLIHCFFFPLVCDGVIFLVTLITTTVLFQLECMVFDNSNQ